MSTRLELAGKSAVITGAARGIGLAMAHRFGAAGMNLVLADVQADLLDGAGAELERHGYRVATAVVDVSDPAHLEALHETADSAFGPVHVLCNNAGIGTGASALSGDIDVWRRALDVNLWSVIHGCTIFVPGMLEHGEGGRVINTASTAGLVASPLMGPYSVSKYGVVAYSETLAMEIAGSTVGVSVLCPAFVKTGIAEGDPTEPDQTTSAEVESIRQVVQSLVHGGIEPSIIADAVIDAIDHDEFWILPQPETRAAVQERTRRILGDTTD